MKRFSSRSLVPNGGRRSHADQPSYIEDYNEDMEDNDSDDDDDDDDDRRRPTGRRGRGGTAGNRMSRGRGRGTPASKNKSIPSDLLDFDSPTRGPKSKPHKRLNVRSAVTLDLDQMVHNCVYYLLIRQHKKVPVKKADIVKFAMNGQFKDFSDVYKTLTFTLDDTFGVRLLQMEIPEEILTSKKTKTLPPPCFIVVSKFNCCVAERNSVRSLDFLAKRAVLYLVLCVSFMLNRAIDEDMIWNILTKLGLEKLVCKHKSELGKFLKGEYVSSHYLRMEELMEKENLVTKYHWGQRSHVEFSTLGVLKFVADQFPGKTIADYPLQYNIVMERDREALELDKARPRNPDGDNGSAIHVEHDQFSIDSQALHSTHSQS